MGSRIIVPGYFGDKGLGFDPLVRRPEIFEFLWRGR